MEEKLLGIKEEGNDYYRKKQLEKALKSYSEGIRLLTHEHEDSEMLCTFYSNRGAVNLSLQNYNNAIAVYFLNF